MKEITEGPRNYFKIEPNLANLDKLKLSDVAETMATTALESVQRQKVLMFVGSP